MEPPAATFKREFHSLLLSPVDGSPPKYPDGADLPRNSLDHSDQGQTVTEHSLFPLLSFRCPSVMDTGEPNIGKWDPAGWEHQWGGDTAPPPPPWETRTHHSGSAWWSRREWRFGSCPGWTRLKPTWPRSHGRRSQRGALAPTRSAPRAATGTRWRPPASCCHPVGHNTGHSWSPRGQGWPPVCPGAQF